LNEPQKLLTVKEVAQRLGQSRFSVYRRVADGTFPAIRIGSTPNAPIRIPERELNEYLYGHEGDA
jgi:excisionase family DNA binding protein